MDNLTKEYQVNNSATNFRMKIFVRGGDSFHTNLNAKSRNLYRGQKRFKSCDRVDDKKNGSN